MTLQRLWNTACWQLVRCGWAGAIGTILILCACIFSYLDEHNTSEKIEHIARERNQIAQEIKRRHSSESDEQGTLKHFRDALANLDALPELLVTLDRNAKNPGIRINRADYSIRDSKSPASTSRSQAPADASTQQSPGIKTVLISLPLKGRYTAVRTWLSDAESLTPALHIESIELQRQKIGDTEIDAQVRLVLYAKDAS